MIAGMNIKGIQEVQQRNLKRIARLKPQNDFGRQVRVMTIGSHRYAGGITHVDTGGLKASHRMEVTTSPRSAKGRVFIDPSATRADGQKPCDYGPYEHARGGEHAFYDRTVGEAGPRLVRVALRAIREMIHRP